MLMVMQMAPGIPPPLVLTSQIRLSKLISHNADFDKALLESDRLFKHGIQTRMGWPEGQEGSTQGHDKGNNNNDNHSSSNNKLGKVDG